MSLNRIELMDVIRTVGRPCRHLGDHGEVAERDDADSFEFGNCLHQDPGHVPLMPGTRNVTGHHRGYPE